MIRSKIVLLLMLCLSSSLAHAGNITWNGPAGGDWNTAANWTPTTIPGSGDVVTINTGASLIITHPLGDIDMGAGSVTLNGGATLLLDGTLKGTGSFIMNGTLNCGAGNLATVSSILNIPTTIGSSGVVSIESGTTGAASLLIQQNVVCDGTLTLHSSNTSGSGEFIDISAGSTLTINGSLNLNNDAGSAFGSQIKNGGTVFVSSSGVLTIKNNEPSLVSVISALVNNAGNLKVSNGTLSLSGSGSVNSGTIVVSDSQTLNVDGSLT